jgi:ABC-type Fe2+-enterobactin transport system substrate-binding protein
MTILATVTTVTGAVEAVEAVEADGATTTNIRLAMDTTAIS